MAWLARELSGNSRVAWVSASLYALSPFAVLYSQEAREYSLWALATLTSSALLLRAARTGRYRYWISYGVATALGLYIYSLTALVMVAQCVFVLATPEYRRRPTIVPYFLASGVGALLFVPWLVTSTFAAGLKGMAPLLASRLSVPAIGMAFARNIRSCVIDFGAVESHVGRPAVTALGLAVLILLIWALWSLISRHNHKLARPYIYSMLIVPALPLLGHDLISGGALVNQARYFEPVYLAIPLALAFLFCDRIFDPKISSAKPIAWASLFALILALGAISCAISANAETWYNKANERTPQVASIINRAERPLVVGDKAVVNDRGTSRVLELSYYLDPTVALRVNLHCDVCLAQAPPPYDVFADASQFENVFVLGELVRKVPAGTYLVSQVGININPRSTAPLEMFAPYP